MNKSEIHKNLLKNIKENPKKYPFISRFWDIELIKESEIETKYIEFGHFETKLTNSIPFYKPFSKIIDLSKL